MKDSVRCVLVCVCVAALACAGECIAVRQPTSAAQQKLEQRIFAALEASTSRGPAVNWMWDNWVAGGPTCVDHRNLTLVDIPGGTESIRTVLETLQKALDNIVCPPKLQQPSENTHKTHFHWGGTCETGNTEQKPARLCARHHVQWEGALLWLGRLHGEGQHAAAHARHSCLGRLHHKDLHNLFVTNHLCSPPFPLFSTHMSHGVPLVQQ